MTQATPPNRPDEFDALLQPLKIMLGLVIAMVAGALIAGGLFISSLRANDRQLEAAVDQIVEARNEARHTTCARANLIREEAGNAAAEKARDFIRAQRAYSGAPESTGRLKAAEDAYIESQRQVTLQSYPKQDCSPAGIDAFYKNPPIDPYADTCIPDGKGLCAK